MWPPCPIKSRISCSSWRKRPRSCSSYCSSTWHCSSCHTSFSTSSRGRGCSCPSCYSSSTASYSSAWTCSVWKLSFKWTYWRLCRIFEEILDKWRPSLSEYWRDRTVLSVNQKFSEWVVHPHCVSCDSCQNWQTLGESCQLHSEALGVSQQRLDQRQRNYN